MSPFGNRLKTPEEIELDRKRGELARLQERLAEREHSLSALKTEIRMFEQVYEEVLGARISELEDLEWQLNGLLGVEPVTTEHDSSPCDEAFAHFHYRTDLLDDDAEQAQDVPRKSLKNLYREVAKAIHPDLASDEEERRRRQELMAAANHAYEVGDRTVLEEILCDRDQGPDVADGLDVAMNLVRVIRQIAGVQQNIHAVARQIAELRGTEIYCFKLRVEDAMSEGIDLLAEMAAAVDLNIAKTRKRLSVLRGDGDAADDPNASPLETRIIRFPADRSCGTLFERGRGSVDYRDWQRLGSARGPREVFLDKAVRLDVKGTTESEMRFLDALQPDDLQALFLYDIDDSALVHLAHFSGLQELCLSNTTVSDEGLRQLWGLHGLRRLYIYHTAISDAGLFSLTRLTGLKWLTCSGTGITEEGLNRFRQALPGCKAVSFKWRFGK
ncbi:MAG: hypothetical protein HYV06_00260 [Deltaproteobacteria bacterium]|nr:hypothetical protein [Deltaproteobacteria bacterium]